MRGQRGFNVNCVVERSAGPRGKSVAPKIDFEALARDLGVMEPWETVGKE